MGFGAVDALFTSTLDFQLKEETGNCYIWSIALYGAETWTVDQKYLECFEMWCWRRMEISWSDRLINLKYYTVTEKRNILHTIKRRKANLIGRILRMNCLLKHNLSN